MWFHLQCVFFIPVGSNYGDVIEVVVEAVHIGEILAGCSDAYCSTGMVTVLLEDMEWSLWLELSVDGYIALKGMGL